MLLNDVLTIYTTINVICIYFFVLLILCDFYFYVCFIIFFKTS